MVNRHRLRGAGTQKRGRGCFGRRTSTPDQPPPAEERDLAVTDDNPIGTSKESPGTTCTGSIRAMDDIRLALEGGASWADGNFVVRLRLDGAQDPTGCRKRWLELLLYGNSCSASETWDPESNDINPDGCRGAGAREPAPRPIAPLAGTAYASIESPAMV